MEQVQTFDQATVEAMVNNMKGILDAWQSDFQQQARQRQGLQDQLNSQYLRFVEDQHVLTMRTADSNAALLARMAGNAATVDNFAALGGLTNPAELAESAIGAKVAGEVRDAAKVAIDAAVAATSQTTAAAQGTTGVAQGAMQAGAGIADAAILAQIAKLAEAVNVLYIKVLGEDNTAEKP